MNECTYDKPDIRVGDLVKATNSEFPEEHRQGRVTNAYGRCVVFESGVLLPTSGVWDFEVLDRPLPEIPEELITGCRNAYIGLPSSTVEPVFYRNDWIKVINYLREHDTYNKESK